MEILFDSHKELYYRNNKSKFKKNLRCFPVCAGNGMNHQEKGFCGSSIKVTVIMRRLATLFTTNIRASLLTAVIRMFSYCNWHLLESVVISIFELWKNNLFYIFSEIQEVAWDRLLIAGALNSCDPQDTFVGAEKVESFFQDMLNGEISAVDGEPPPYFISIIHA